MSENRTVVAERVVRLAAETDTAALRDLDDVGHGTSWPDDYFADSIERSDVLHLVVDEDAQLVAHACMHFEDDVSRVANVAVAESARRRGLADMLMTQLLDAAVLRAPARPCVLEVRADNTAAVALYRSFGFVPCGIRRDRYPLSSSSGTSDALVMTLDDPAMGAARRKDR